MAGANISVSAGLRFGSGVQSQGLNPSPNYTQVGSHALNSVQDVTTIAEALTVGDIASLKYACIYNPSDSATTLTVTCASQVLAPGDAILVRAGAVTMQATSAYSYPVAATET
jgi:hypothetical protein